MGASLDRPKPLVAVGDQPVIAHVMDIYRSVGVREFIVCAGHRYADFEVWAEEERARSSVEIVLVDTGADTSSGGRLRRVAHLLDSSFFLTYADGLSDVDLGELVQLHQESAAAVTVTAFPLALRYGVIDIDEGAVLALGYQEKPVLERKWGNGGFYVVEPAVVHELCTDDQVGWEEQVLPKVAAGGRLAVMRHDGFWASMDFAHQRDELHETWRSRGPVWLAGR